MPQVLVVVLAASLVTLHTLVQALAVSIFLVPLVVRQARQLTTRLAPTPAVT
jgi:hypothetical protein